ncbi:hypothetical protein F4811DRAFT_545190 [Daldinia bambusicola]|nr:hypothetical protein F4811DRAFT_545190 [Daldinia bambusicola]
MASSPPQFSLLLSLPTEIRLIIYEFVLRQDGPIMLCRENDRRYTVPHDVDHQLFSFSEEASRDGSNDITLKLHSLIIESSIPPTPVDGVRHTALLETCRQVNEEATPVLFSHNMIVVSTPCDGVFPHWPLNGFETPHFKRLTVWVSPSVVNDFMLWLHVNEVFDIARSIERVTILFQEDISGMREEILEDAYDSAGRYLRYGSGQSPHTVDIGFFPSLRHAFDNFSGSYP